jgi:protein-L-isoaspartate(D-aspartate) O-methyltransferase
MKKRLIQTYSEYGRFSKRQKMTDTLRFYGIRNPEVLSAFQAIPRHLFVPEEYDDKAYADTPLPIGYGQTISQPYVVAFMLEHMDLKPGSKVLEIGSGCGYVTALLSRLVFNVIGVELEKALADRSRRLLQELKINNVRIVCDDGYKGFAPSAPYDSILVSAAPPTVPKALTEQLKENGSLIIPVGKESQMLKKIQKKNGKIIENDLLDVRFVPLRPSNHIV